MKKHNNMGRSLYYIGTFLSAFGIAFELLEDAPDSLSVIAMPLIIIGVILLIASNFFRKTKGAD
ncbi:hypothetical protein SAMN05216238_1126 [Lentibacillus persicus]|uniref:Uncharacterized protein n=1 Tax=Lentibacillus persicus TaxID=640948 RepID=A0A1I1ZD47_9BACI|nr:hypothetical protein [Lentibacillus persicus]SFE28240.1 hypothetical protein SAMN05216238_1126 [Lentibacillus persicus]